VPVPGAPSVNCTGRLAVAHALTGNYPQSIAASHRAHELRHAAGDLHGAATALLNLAATYVNAGQPDDAIEYLTQVEQLRSQLPQADHIAVLVQTNLGEAHHLAHHYDLAQHHYEQALTLAVAASKGRETAQIHIGLGILHLDINASHHANTHLIRGLVLAEQHGDSALQDEAHEGLGRLHSYLGDHAIARRHLQQALAGYQAIGHLNAGRVQQLLAQLDVASA